MPFFKEIEHFGVTDVGVKRSHNQDAFTVQTAPDRDHWNRVGHLFLVADGMGGHAVGEKASAKAVQEIPLTYVKHAQDGPAAALRRAFQEANAGINAIGTSNPEFRGLGTTATAIALRAEGAWLAHVGDSRAYRIRNNVIQQLTYDHSYAWEMARRLGIPPEELGDVKKNVIVRSLGPDPLVQVDIEGPHPLQDGDTFVLCSDGLSNLVPPEEIGAVISSLPLDEACRLLVEIANLRGGPDNITVLAVRVGTTRDSMSGSALRRRRPLRDGLRWLAGGWNRTVPWPISILLVGFVLTMVFVLFAANQWQGTAAVFVAAVLTIVAGLIGLVLHARREITATPPEFDAAPKASIYRQYPVRIDAGLIEQWTTAAIQLKEQVEARQLNVDWSAYRNQADAAAKAVGDQDFVTAFRCQCRALARLARPFNANRPREESFRPRFEPTEG